MENVRRQTKYGQTEPMQRFVGSKPLAGIVGFVITLKPRLLVDLHHIGSIWSPSTVLEFRVIGACHRKWIRGIMRPETSIVEHLPCNYGGPNVITREKMVV